MSKSKSKFLIPAVGAAVVAIGALATYVYLKLPAGDTISPLGTAKFVPAKALMATYVSTDSQSWAKLEQFGSPEVQELLRKNINNFDKQLLPGSNISYEQDIKPWVGGLMIAVLPPEISPPPKSNLPVPPKPDANVLLVVGIKDKISALNFANKVKSAKDVKTVESNYQGEKIIESQGKRNSTYISVLNNTHLLISAEKTALKTAIDTFKGKPSFASKEGASAILSKGADMQNSLAQIYVPDYGNMVQQLTALNSPAQPLPPQTVAQLKQIKSLVAGVGVDDAGLRLKAIANLDPQTAKFQYQNSPAKIISNFPAETFALVSGQSINKSWQTVVEQSKEFPEFNQALAQARGQLKFLNLDLDKDIFGWMNGEFAFGAIQSNQGLLANVGFGGALVFDTSDRQTAEATLAKIDTLAKQQALNISQRNISGKKVTEWQIPQQGTLLAHGWLDQDTVFVALGGPVAETLANTKNKPLDSSANFKSVTNSLQKPNGGYFYLDMDQTATLINRFASQTQPLPPETKAILGSIRGLGVTVNSPDKSTSQMEMLLALKPSQSK
ncbi:hypothetical protein B6N60_01305 [Richelia sinica FACHB-800]|uniref:Uncharacterized protein n=1 Tax=Richelia sinica FACHB-800 TaxID=1357546 RepID=A0A975Y3Y5_9NOST|nr:DUF3352 domain-containing protein [Richelia sinica]MBD2663800.1 DUF3352 domain-containing protein [Richelia sinica FACHB-800]QXE22620.1 hypothetical protein B6N60_01305 [Richelia sinica FACHB-800]